MPQSYLTSPHTRHIGGPAAGPLGTSGDNFICTVIIRVWQVPEIVSFRVITKISKKLKKSRKKIEKELLNDNNSALLLRVQKPLK